MNRFFPRFFRFPLSRVLLLASILSLLIVANESQCDDRIPISERMRTELSFELILPRVQSNPLAAQQWGNIFKKAGISVRIRQRQFNDVEGVNQFVYGTIRRVKVTGQIDRRGNIVLPGKIFRLTNVEKLREWIEELQLYGAQGVPSGQPLWGMKKTEFEQLYAELSKPVSQETSGLNLNETIRALELPEKYPLRFVVEAKDHLAALEGQQSLPEMSHDLRQVSKGTALSIVLRSYLLAFSPRRLPNESIDLTVENSQEIDTPWPVGWEPNTLGLERLVISKKMYIVQTIEIQDLSFLQFLSKIQSETEIALFVDPQAILAGKLNLENLTINFPRKKTSWSLCLRTVLSKIKLTQQLRVDENHRPFIWITKYDPKKSQRKSLLK